MSRKRSVVASLGLLVTGFVFGGLLNLGEIGRAQHDLASYPTARTEREKLYNELRQEVSLLERESNVLKKVAKLVAPTVVHIDAESRRMLGGSRSGVVEEAGSGVLVDLGGTTYVLTNRHVVVDHDLDEIQLTLFDRREIRPKKLWSDAATDVAVLAIDEPNLVTAPVGDSDLLEIGDFVVAVGSPFGLSRSVTLGIISAMGRRDLELGESTVEYQDFLQTDAAINPGNSGGPLVNLRGEVVGINTAIASNSGGNEGIGFSIPANMALRIARQLVETGTVARAFLGVTPDQNFTAAEALRVGLPRPYGARVKILTAGGPAERASIRLGDVILRFNDRQIEDDVHLINVVGLTQVGAEVPILLWRDGQEMHLTVRVGNRNEFALPAVRD